MKQPALATVLILALAACGGANAPLRPSALALDDPLFTRNAGPARMLLDDEFSGSALDTKLWFTCYSWVDPGQGCSNNPSLELEWYEARNVSVSGGYLRLTARAQHVKKNFPYTSGMVQTGGTASGTSTFAYLYGYAEIRARLPRGAGMWPAFWLVPSNRTWPPEIDIMEWQGVDPKGDVVTIHWRDRSGALQQNSSTYYDSAPLYAGYHVYGLDWEPGAVTWYLDGKPIKRYTDREWIPHLPMIVILNLAIGGWEKHQLDPSPKSFPATFSIDYVRIWNRKP